MSSIQKPQHGSASLSKPASFLTVGLTSDQLLKSRLKIWQVTPNATSSLVSVAGPTHSNSPVGRQRDLFGPEAAPANHSATQASNLAPPTNATSGQPSSPLSASADLQRSLASRLRARLHSAGSMEYALTWKERTTPSLRQICALRAQAHPKSASASSGWPTPIKQDGASSGVRDYKPTATHHSGTTLTDAARLAGWATPTVQDAKNNAGPSQFQRNSNPLNVEATFGVPTNFSPAPMEKRGALNPAHSRWLMGFPAGWNSCGATAMQSCRKSRLSSSKPAKKQQ